MGRSMYIMWALFVFEDVRLSLEGEAEALHARGHEANYNSKLYMKSSAGFNHELYFNRKSQLTAMLPAGDKSPGPMLPVKPRSSAKLARRLDWHRWPFRCALSKSKDKKEVLFLESTVAWSR